MRITLFSLFLLFVLPFSGMAHATPAGRDFGVFFSNDVQGKIEPCG